MDIILIRHGVAEERGSRTDDSKRELTQRGRDKLKSAAEILGGALEADKVELWHSPTVRTVQTAEILRDELGLDTMASKDWIASGNDSEFHKALAESEAETVIIAGHAPILDFWCEDLCDERVCLKKGGAVCIRMAEGRVGELIWLMQPKGWKMFS